jgi:hypothetical protein
MRRIAWFALKFVALTVPLTWLWVAGGRELYGATFASAADVLYEWVGYHGANVPWRERYINVVPYVALVLLTPGLGWRRRGIGLALGLVAILCAQLILNAVAQWGRPHPVSFPVGIAVLSDAMPFLLWAILARDFVRDLVRGVAGPSGDESEAVDSTEPTS